MQRRKRLLACCVSLVSLCFAFLIGDGVTLPACVAGAQQRPEEKVKQLLKVLDSTNDVNVWLSVVTLLGELGTNPLTPDELVDLRSRSDRPTEAAASASDAIQTELRDLASDRLAKRLTAGKPLDPRLYRAILLALGRIRAPIQVAAPAWQAALRDKDVAVRMAVVSGLESYLSRSKEIRDVFPRTDRQFEMIAQYVHDMAKVPAVIRTALEDRDTEVRTGALVALSRMLTDHDKLEPLALVMARPEAVTELRRDLPEIADGLRGLRSVLESVLASGTDEQVRLVMEVCEEIARLRDPRVDRDLAVGRLLQPDLGEEGQRAAAMLTQMLRDLVPAIAGKIGSSSVDSRIAALGILELLGPDAKPAVPAIAKALQDRNRFVRWGAARALGRIGATKNGVFEGLGEQLSDDDLDVAGAAARALEDCGRDALPAVPALAKALARDDPTLRLSLLFALRAVGPDERSAATVVPAIAVALNAPQARVRREVPPVLAMYGPKAKTAVPALKALLDDPDAEVRQSASEALLKILGQQ